MTKKSTFRIFRYVGIVSLSVVLIGLGSCKKKSDPAPAPAPATTNNNSNSSAGTTSATVDGATFKGTSGVIVAPSPYAYFLIYTVDVTNTSAFKELLVYVPGTPSVKTYTLGVNNGTTDGWGWYYSGTSYANYTGYYTDATNTGTLTISKYDVTNKKISGTFSFKAMQYYPTAGTGTVNVTSGSFTDVSWQ